MLRAGSPINGGNSMTPSRSPAEETGPTATMQHHRLPARYKTKLCINFTTDGSCPYGSTCLFAHGEGELRTSTEKGRTSRHGRRPTQNSTPSVRPVVKVLLEELRTHRSPASLTARRESCVQLARHASTASNAPATTSLEHSRAHGAPQRDPYAAVNMISLVPDCGH